MNLQIRFTDGTTEERDAASPARRMIDTKHGLRRDDIALCDCRGADDIEVKRGDAWAPCRVETHEEQIERLTAERDAAHNAYVLRDAWALLWKGWAREFWQDARSNIATPARLRAAARGAVDREMGNGHRYPENVKTSTLIAHLNTMDFGERNAANIARERDAALGQVNALHKVVTISDVDRAVEHAATKVRAANAERERDAARRMVVLRSGGIKSSKEARELDALTNQAIEEGWFKVP